MVDYLDTDEFVQDFRIGEQRAFTLVFKVWFKQMYMVAFKFTGNETESEDIVIQAFTKIFERHTQFNALPAIKSYLFLTVRNACLNYLTQQKRLTERQKMLQHILDDDQALNNAQIEAEVIQLLYASIEKLPSECKRVLQMIYIEGMKYREVAEKLGISIKTVESQRKYALDKLRKVMPERYLLSVWLLCAALSHHVA